MNPVGDLKDRIDELADLMDEHGLEKAELKGDGWAVGFDRNGPEQTVVASGSQPRQTKPEKKKETPTGTPVTSPMAGIFYESSNPGAPPFVKVGQTVNAGEVVGLIEAMKVFNEITAPVAGDVTAIMAESGQLVQPGDPLIYIG